MVRGEHFIAYKSCLPLVMSVAGACLCSLRSGYGEVLTSPASVITSTCPVIKRHLIEMPLKRAQRLVHLLVYSVMFLLVVIVSFFYCKWCDVSQRNV